MSDKMLAYFGRVDDYIIPETVPTLSSDTALNDSDKTFTVTTDKVWEVLWIRYEITATATAGTRTPEIQFRDSSDDVIWSVAGATITGTQSSTQQASNGAAGDLELPGRVLLDEAWDIRVADTAAIDAAADDLVVHIVYIEHDKVA